MEMDPASLASSTLLPTCDEKPIIGHDGQLLDDGSTGHHLLEWPPTPSSTSLPLDNQHGQWNQAQPCLLVTSLPSPSPIFQCQEIPSPACSCFNFYQIPSLPPPSAANEMIIKPKIRRGRPPNPQKQASDIGGQYDCILCEFTSQSLNEFLKHIELHAGPDQPYVCQLCGKAFKFLLAWRNHICSHLSLRPFECGICTARYITNGELIRHKRYKHGGGKPHKCTLCSYECVELAKLMRHQRMHAGLKPFKCPSCHYESYDKSKIRRHYVTHTREKPFKCEICSSSFTQSGSLKTHLTNVHGMNKVEFRCPFCSKLVTPNMGELRNHIKTLHHMTDYPVIVKGGPTDQENLHLHQQQQLTISTPAATMNQENTEGSLPSF